MKLSFTPSLVLLAVVTFGPFSAAQISSAAPHAPKSAPSGSTLTLRAASIMNVASEMGGAFMPPAKCDADGNLYIRKFAADQPLLGPVVKIDAEGKRTALFDPAAFSQLNLDRADAFSPATDGGIYQIAQSGVLKPRIYVLHFSADAAASSPVRLDANLEVYTFAAFADGNFLISGVKRDAQDKNDRERNFTAVFSAEGRELAQLSFEKAVSAAEKPKAEAVDGQHEAPRPTDKGPALDLADAEAGSDGNLYVLRRSAPALVYVIASSGKIMKTLKVSAASHDGAATGFHVSGNRLAISFWNEASESQTVEVADAQTGRKIVSYTDPGGLGPSFACYSANEGTFTFLKLGEGNALQVIQAEVQ